MTGVAARLAAVFVEPSPRAGVRSGSAIAVPDEREPPSVLPAGGDRPPGSGLLCVVALCSPQDAGLLGVAVAAELARRHDASCAVVCRHGAASRGAAGPPTAAARRLCAALVGAGLDATVGGRIVAVALPDDPAQAAAAGERVLALAECAPVVTVLAAGRSTELDGLIGEHDAAVVTVAATAPAGLVAAVVADLEAVSSAVACIDAPTGPAARALCGRGAFAAPGLRGPIGCALDAIEAGTRGLDQSA